MTRRLTLAAAALLALPALTGCSDPCASLAPPTAAERQVVADAERSDRELELEVEVDGTDCALTDGGRWKQDD